MAIRLRVEYAATWRFSARGEASGGLRTRPRLAYAEFLKLFPIAGVLGDPFSRESL